MGEIGSPPHAWGDSQADSTLHPAERFTPTRVGRLAAPTIVRLAITVHPHTRGEIFISLLLSQPISGSPPHAWGDSDLGKVLGRQHRFTPTRVGRLSGVPGSTRLPSVHPHTRGEIPSLRICHSIEAGSPPHAWGDSLRRALPGSHSRFTPTRVGRFTNHVPHMACLPVHPHTRGEILPFSDSSSSFFGSPPHAWGDSIRHGFPHPIWRFTPTRVGRFAAWHLLAPGDSVHPHTRGEISCSRRRLHSPLGSPPHAWGDYLWAPRMCWACRFTPTRVGTLSISGNQSPSNPVHPHTRGDINLHDLRSA